MKYYKFHNHDSGKVLYNLFSGDRLNVVYYFLKIINIKIYGSNSKMKYMQL